ncbi:YdaU family protein [Bartonella harrusi]|uniref:YdaU family protein n=1 Tax=Bartonella harrusi TaxID=2961895 RepID=A0ABY5EVG4_9HYPH|nr:YdaU family protein [Bartonella harrusi]UTO29217.1 YdaU family protein [Bartonella harrusi]
MSSKLPWTRLFADKWVINLACLPSIEGNVYMRLRLQMLHTGEPLVNNLKVLAHYTGYSVKTFVKALDVLLSMGHIIRLEDGRLWNLDVEEEFNNSNGNLDKVSKTSRSKRLSERAQKAAIARWNKHKNDACDHAKAPENTENDAKNDAKVVKHDAKSMLKDAKHDAYDMLDDAYIYNINNNTNINSYNKKTNTIVLAKKENDFEDLKTNEQVDEPSEDHDCEKRADAIETVAEDQPAIHEQENIPKKAKRSKANRGCRLPDDFEPDYDFAIAEGLPPERVKVEIAKFRDYWKAKTGKDATKTDWQATWRNWVRRAIDDLTKGRNYGKPNIAQTEQQRGKSYRVAQYMSDIKNSDSAYKFLFGDDERTTIPLVTGTKTLDCRSGANYLTSQ